MQSVCTIIIFLVSFKLQKQNLHYLQGLVWNLKNYDERKNANIFKVFRLV